MREDRSALELELAPAIGRFHHDVSAENVRWHEVGRELDPAEGEIKHFTQRADEQRLAQTWNAFEQDVSASENGCKRTFNNGVSADHYFSDFGAQGVPGVAEILDLGFSAHLIWLLFPQAIEAGTHRNLQLSTPKRLVPPRPAASC